MEAREPESQPAQLPPPSTKSPNLECKEEPQKVSGTGRGKTGYTPTPWCRGATLNQTPMGSQVFKERWPQTPVNLRLGFVWVRGEEVEGLLSSLSRAQAAANGSGPPAWLLAFCDGYRACCPFKRKEGMWRQARPNPVIFIMARSKDPSESG